MGIEKAKRVSDPTRLMKGDVLVVPKGCALTQLTLKTLSRLGLHNGYTCRSINSSKMVSAALLNSSNDTMMFYIEPSYSSETRTPAPSRRASLLSNYDGFDDTPKTICANLYPMNTSLSKQFLSASGYEYDCTGFAAGDVADILFGCKIPASVPTREKLHHSFHGHDTRDRKLRELCNIAFGSKPDKVPTFFTWGTQADKNEKMTDELGHCSEDSVMALFVEPTLCSTSRHSIYVDGMFVKNACERGCHVARFSEGGISKAVAEFVARKIAEQVLQDFSARIERLEGVAAMANEGILTFRKRYNDFENAVRGLMKADKSEIDAAVKEAKEAR